MHTSKTQTIEQFTYNVRARINAGATAEQAVDGALREGGPLRAVRVSSAQAKGAAKGYAYWGAVRYQIRLTADGRGYCCAAIERASSDRRSVKLAVKDAEDLAAAEGRAWALRIGRVSSTEIASHIGVL